MKTLHVRGVPESLYKELQRLARSSNRSLSEQVINMLSQAIKKEGGMRNQKDVLASIRQRRFAPPLKSATLSMLREDRER